MSYSVSLKYLVSVSMSCHKLIQTLSSVAKWRRNAVLV